LIYFEENCKLHNAAENVEKTADLWLHFSDRVWKIEAPLIKNNPQLLINNPLTAAQAIFEAMKVI